MGPFRMSRLGSRIVRWFVVLAVLPIALWSGYWVAGAYTLEQATARAFNEARRAGAAAEFDEAAVSGYPTRFATSLADISVSGENLVWQTQAVMIDAESHRPFDIALDLSEPHRIAGRFGDLGVDASEAQVTALFRPEWELPLDRIALDATEVFVNFSDQGRIDMTRVLSALQQDPDSMTTYRVAAAIEDMVLNGLLVDLPPDYHIIPEVRLDGLLRFDRAWDRSVLEEGAPLLVELVLSRAAFEFGSSAITLQAQLSRDQHAAVSGTVNVTVQGWRSLFDLALEVGYIDLELESFFLPILQELASQEVPETELSLPLRIEDGTVSFGAITLGMLPTVP
ncbi:hypothetical protein CKO19_16480 [Rhodovulum adriaticum]|nr:hypothetical protein [Rhodovulum adriaticum]